MSAFFCWFHLIRPCSCPFHSCFPLHYCCFVFGTGAKNCISRALLTTLNIIRIFRSEIHVTFWTGEWARCSPLSHLLIQQDICVSVCMCQNFRWFCSFFFSIIFFRCLVSSLCHFLLTFLFYLLLSNIEEGESRTESSLNWFYIWDSFISRRLSKKSYR